MIDKNVDTYLRVGSNTCNYKGFDESSMTKSKLKKYDKQHYMYKKMYIKNWLIDWCLTQILRVFQLHILWCVKNWM